MLCVQISLGTKGNGKADDDTSTKRGENEIKKENARKFIVEKKKLSFFPFFESKIVKCRQRRNVTVFPMLFSTS